MHARMPVHGGLDWAQFHREFKDFDRELCGEGASCVVRQDEHEVGLGDKIGGQQEMGTGNRHAALQPQSGKRLVERAAKKIKTARRN